MNMTMTPPMIQVLDPAMCSSTGVCRPEAGPKLVPFAADLDCLKSAGVIIQRYDLSQNPGAIVDNELVRSTLSRMIEPQAETRNYVEQVMATVDR
ncbi:MAG TPA: arsenic metallochaperone ArsD family protein [Candidatus Acidoferrales bacterium]|nr:arsenic metallochaperone ArsD family protein [Candidatus Acidoferrales bacterium]